MATEDPYLLKRFVPLVRGLPDYPVLRKQDLLVPAFSPGQDGGVEVYYAPSHHVNEQARLVRVGIPPGGSQAEIAFRRTRHYLLRGCSPSEASRQATQEASFAGPMRTRPGRRRQRAGED